MSEPSREGVIAGLPPGTFSGLFRAVDALRNIRAFVAMLGCTVIGVLVAGVFSMLAARLGFFFGFLGGLSMLVAGAAGLSAAGVLLMDQARGLPSRSLTDALVYGLMCIPKFILLALTLAAVALAVFLGIAVVYAVCKIPILGPILFVGVFPLSVLVAGLTVSGLALCMMLSLPAVWEGAPILRAITQVMAIARTRPVESLLMLFMVGLLSGAVGLIACSLLFAGLVPTVTLAAAIFGGEGLGALLGTAPAGVAAADGSSYGLAAGIGGMLLWALVGTLVSMVSLMGLDIVYLRVTQGLDVAATEDALRTRLDEARRQATDFGQKARDAAERAREQARQSVSQVQASQAHTVASVHQAGDVTADDAAAPAAAATQPPPAPPPQATERPPREAPPESTTPAVAKALTCPHCLSAIGKGDVFCGVCGYRL